MGSMERVATGSDCQLFRSHSKEGSPHWKLVKELLFFRKRESETDHRICLAEGSLTKRSLNVSSQNNIEIQSWRAFQDTACDKHNLATREPDGKKIHWTMIEEFYIPHSASGDQVCLCVLHAKKNLIRNTISSFYKWSDGECKGGDKGAPLTSELCLRSISVDDVLRVSYLIDDVI